MLRRSHQHRRRDTHTHHGTFSLLPHSSQTTSLTKTFAATLTASSALTFLIPLSSAVRSGTTTVILSFAGWRMPSLRSFSTYHYDTDYNASSHDGVICAPVGRPSPSISVRTSRQASTTGCGVPQFPSCPPRYTRHTSDDTSLPARTLPAHN
jgi:hypothetical protein